MTRNSTVASAPVRSPTSLRENVCVHDITDCLIEAYDCVARLAYEKFVARGAHAGGELDDWLTAEHELLDHLPADIQESDESITALVSLPGLTASQIKIGIESRWLVIVSRTRGDVDRARSGDAGGNARHEDASANSENRGEDGGANDDGSDPDSRDPDSRDPDDEACEEIEAEKVAEFSRAVHGDRQRERNGAGSIGPSDDLHGRRRVLDVNTFVGHALSGEAISGKRKRGEGVGGGATDGKASSGDAANGGAASGDASSGKATSGEASGRDTAYGRSSRRPQHLFAILELPAEVDASRAVAVLADGLLGLRMPKKLAASE